jgi:hypothetical protein
VVLAKLGLDQFSPLSVRLLELLAAQAAVAFENARLHELQRRATAMSEALLAIARLTTADPTAEAIAGRVVDAACDLAQAHAAVVMSTAAVPAIVAFAGMGLDHPAIALARRPSPVGPGDVSVISLPDGHGVAAMTLLHGAVLVAVAERFTPVTLAALRAVSGQGSLALRNAELMALIAETG